MSPEDVFPRLSNLFFFYFFTSIITAFSSNLLYPLTTRPSQPLIIISAVLLLLSFFLKSPVPISELIQYAIAAGLIGDIVISTTGRFEAYQVFSQRCNNTICRRLMLSSTASR
jgi:hypothetical protein